MEMGDEYILDLKKHYDLDEGEKYDIIPEVWNGRNIADFIDPEIEAKLEALEREEEERINSGYYDFDLDSEDEDLQEIRSLAKQIREKKGIMKFEQRMNNTNKPTLGRTGSKVSNSYKHECALPAQTVHSLVYDENTNLPKHSYLINHDYSVLLLSFITYDHYILLKLTNSNFVFLFLQRDRSLSRLRSEQRDLGVDISSDEEGNHWDESIDTGIAHPPLKKMRTDEEGHVRSSSTVPRNKTGVKDEKVCCGFFCKGIIFRLYWWYLYISVWQIVICFIELFNQLISMIF